MSNEGLEAEFAAIRRLWAGVVIAALREMDSGNPEESGAARRYVMRKHGRTGVGSIVWICSMLDLDVELLRRMAATRAGRRNLTYITRDLL